MKQNTQTFTGQDAMANTTGTTYVPNIVYDKVVFCPYCGKKLPETNNSIIYCPYCGKEIPQTTTQGMFIYHWNSPITGEQTWPRDGITRPYTSCNTI